MSLVTGMTTINVTDTSNERVEFYNMAAGTTIDVLATDTTNTTVEVVYANDTSTTDSQTFIVAAATADDNVALVIDDIETINISSDTANQVDLSLAGVSMTAATARNTVNFTGTNDIELSATGGDVSTINASGMGTGGAIVQTARTSAEASTYTGSGGNDTLIMMHSSDVMDGGAGTGDTLDVNLTQAVGTSIIDLSSADQIATLNGGANSAVQTGFENIDLAGLLINGAVVTGTSAANTITGSGLVDQIDGGGGADVIRGGAGADVLTGGAGADYMLGGTGLDTLTGGTGADQFAFHSSAAANLNTITDFTSSDIIVFGADANGADSDLFDAGSTILPDTDASALTVAAAGNGGTVTVPTADYNEAASITGTIIAEHINVVTGAGAASVTALLNAIDDGAGTMAADDTDFILIFYNTTTSKVEMWDVQEAGTTGGNYADETATQFATFDGIAAADIAATFANTNFAVELIA